MPTYEVRRRTVLAASIVTAANETEARIMARDVWQQDAAIAALTADVTRQPHLEPYDRLRDDESTLRYEFTQDDAEDEQRELERLSEHAGSLLEWPGASGKDAS